MSKWENYSLIQVTQEEARCSLLGSSFGYVLQLSLGILAFLALVLKRYQEPEKIRRPWTIWAADSSKQALGAFVAHGANMLLSYGWSSNQTNECLLYLVNFSTDCIFGVAINVIILKFSIHVAEKYFESDALESGEYGSPFEWSRWLTQCAFWIAVVLLGKIVLVVALVLPFKDPLYTITDFIFSPLHRYPHVQLVLVMVVIPLFLNAATFWIQDAYLMKPLVPTTSSVSGMYVDDYFIGGSMGGVDEDGYGEGNDIHQPILKDVDS